MTQFFARLLLPLKTNCWVCNMLRGVGLGAVMALPIGIAIGARWF